MSRYGLKCKLRPGSFSDEIIFSFHSVEDVDQKGVASKQYCWTSDQQKIEENGLKSTTDGIVAVKVIRVESDSHVLVLLPDGDVATVNQNQLVSRPSEASADVSV